jgi:hypothetical protein
LFTVGIVGLLERSLYDPDVATVERPKFIVLPDEAFVVKLSPVSLVFFLIVIVELFTVGILLLVPSATSSNVKVISDDKVLLFTFLEVGT